MEIFTKNELRMRRNELIQKIKDGVVFIHPTDTIYGLGCSALHPESVKKIRTLKERPDSPFSIWIPSVEWAERNCEINAEVRKWFDKLPGPYTLILKCDDKSGLAKNINPGKDTLGIRLPNHWFSEVVRELGLPIVTTSANKAGEPFMTSLDDLDYDIEKGVDFIIFEGVKEGSPSKIVKLNGEIEER
jgi:tRNA threonylcarbamoyl adenosine modification protein (Sua5/YciO/YrdC/YwlC family)